MRPTSIIIKSISLINFKGIRNLTISFNGKETSIKGENATGKTTIMDAFTWLLFGKDSKGRSDFEIKTLGPNGEPFHDLNHEVRAILQINDEKILLGKIYREKWVKTRGQKDLNFSGHETTYFYNDVPLAQKDYNTKIELLCPEKIFKLLTNPHYFPELNWTEQRQLLLNVAGEVSNDEIASGNPAFMELLSSLQNNKNLMEYKREIAMKKKRISEQLDEIPPRIDEVTRSIPSVMDWKEIESQIKVIQSEITRIDSEIADKSKGFESENLKRLDLQNEINLNKTSLAKLNQEITTKTDNLKFEYERALRQKSQNIGDMEETIGLNQNRIKGLEGMVESLRKQREAKLQEWHKINNETLKFKQDTICPTCGQALPADFLNAKKTEAESKFNTAKSVKLQFNVSEGKKIAADIHDAESKINICRAIIMETEKKLTDIKSLQVPVPDYEAEQNSLIESKGVKKYEITGRISSLEGELELLGPAKVADISDLQSARKEKQITIDSLKRDLAKRDYIESGNQRIQKLKDDQQRLSQELADNEKIEFVIAAFSKAKIETLQAKINGMFRIVRFKMFIQQINGGEQETCECTAEGVPYSDLNNAMKINAGLDILSTLSDKYGIIAPVFIDNRESINDLLPVNSQLINLIVTTDKELVFN